MRRLLVLQTCLWLGGPACGRVDTIAPDTSPGEEPGVPAIDPDADGALIAPTVALSSNRARPKALTFTWPTVANAAEYHLWEGLGQAALTRVATQIGRTVEGSISHHQAVGLPFRLGARYQVEVCNRSGCVRSNEVTVSATQLNEAIGYIKPSNANIGDEFGSALALSGDGATLVVGAQFEDSTTSGVNPVLNNAGNSQGAAYVFVREGSQWRQHSVLKANNASELAYVGTSVAINFDGSTIAVGASGEGGGGPEGAGAVYVFSKAGGAWSQTGYIKATNGAAYDAFGSSLSISADGTRLAIGAPNEDSSVTGINSDASLDTASSSGAAYVFDKVGTTWTQRAYIKSSNSEAGDEFGYAVALSGNGTTLVVGATGEAGNSASTPFNNSVYRAGAAYVFTAAGVTWTQQIYLKADAPADSHRCGHAVAVNQLGNVVAFGCPNAGNLRHGAVYTYGASGAAWTKTGLIQDLGSANDGLGSAVALSSDGTLLAAGAPRERSPAAGIGTTSTDVPAQRGATYLFTKTPAGWANPVFIKAANPDPGDEFGVPVALSYSGQELAVGARFEASAAKLIGGAMTNNGAQYAGAVYLY